MKFRLLGNAVLILVVSLRASARLLARDEGTTTLTSSISPSASPTTTPSVPSGRIACLGTPFTCPSSAKCIITAPDNSTVLCCPYGNDCSTIAPITCDIQQQNATTFPNSSLYTTLLESTLTSCGSQTCCPNGYSCGSTNMCSLNPSTPTSSAVSSTTPTPTGTNIPVIVPTSIANTNETTSQAPIAHSNPFPPGAIVLGLFLGLVCGVSATLLVMWCLRRRRQQKNKVLPSPDFMGKTPPAPASPVMKSMPDSRLQHRPTGSANSTVSEPMWANAFDGGHRTDFLRRGDSKTGYEHQMKPSWSSNESGASTATTGSTAQGSIEKATPMTVQRVHSMRRNFTAPASTGRDPFTPPSQTDTASGRKPMFENATRFGLPITPTPAPRSKEKPQRPARSDEFVPTMSGGLAASHDANNRVRDDSQTRPLVQHDVLSRAQEDYARQAQALQRSDTSHSVESRSSSIATHDSVASSKASSGEVMTIHLDTPGRSPAAYLAPPAPLFAAKDEHGRPQTTFADLMVRAGWKEGDGWHTTSVPNRR